MENRSAGTIELESLWPECCLVLAHLPGFAFIHGISVILFFSFMCIKALLGLFFLSFVVYFSP